MRPRALAAAVTLGDCWGVFAVRPSDLLVPAAGESALVVAGTEAVRTGEEVVFLKVIAVVPARDALLSRVTR